MKQQKFSISNRLSSFKYAYNGLKILLKEEHNSRVHLLAGVLVSVAGFVFNISAYEWMAIVFCVGLVIVLEILNSAIENICDFISPDMHNHIKKIKDLSAAAVLISAVVSVVIGTIIFLPKFYL